MADGDNQNSGAVADNGALQDFPSQPNVNVQYNSEFTPTERYTKSAQKAYSETYSKVEQKVIDGIKENPEILQMQLGHKIETDEEFRNIADQLMHEGALKIQNPDGTQRIVTLAEMGLEKDIPSYKQTETIAKSVANAVDNNSSDIGLFGGASFTNIIMAFFEWMAGIGNGDGRGFKEILANITADNIANDIRNDTVLAQSGVSKENILQIAEAARTQTLAEAKVNDTRQPTQDTAVAGDTPPANDTQQPTGQQQSSQNNQAANSEQPAAGVEQNTKNTTKTDPTKSNTEKVSTVASATAVAATVADNSSNKKQSDATVKDNKPDNKDKADAPSVPEKSIKSVSEVIIQVTSDVMKDSNGAQADMKDISAVSKNIEKTFRGNPSLSGKELAGKIADNLLADKTTRDLVIAGAEKEAQTSSHKDTFNFAKKTYDKAHDESSIVSIDMTRKATEDGLFSIIKKFGLVDKISFPLQHGGEKDLQLALKMENEKNNSGQYASADCNANDVQCQTVGGSGQKKIVTR